MSEKITIAEAISFYEGRINSQLTWLETFRDGRPQDRRGAMDIEQHERIVHADEAYMEGE